MICDKCNKNFEITIVIVHNGEFRQYCRTCIFFMKNPGLTKVRKKRRTHDELVLERRHKKELRELKKKHLEGYRAGRKKRKKRVEAPDPIDEAKKYAEANVV